MLPRPTAGVSRRPEARGPSTSKRCGTSTAAQPTRPPGPCRASTRAAVPGGASRHLLERDASGPNGKGRARSCSTSKTHLVDRARRCSCRTGRAARSRPLPRRDARRRARPRQRTQRHRVQLLAQGSRARSSPAGRHPTATLWLDVGERELRPARRRFPAPARSSWGSLGDHEAVTGCAYGRLGPRSAPQTTRAPGSRRTPRHPTTRPAGGADPRGALGRHVSAPFAQLGQDPARDTARGNALLFGLARGAGARVHRRPPPAADEKAAAAMLALSPVVARLRRATSSGPQIRGRRGPSSTSSIAGLGARPWPHRGPIAPSAPGWLRGSCSRATTGGGALPEVAPRRSRARTDLREQGPHGCRPSHGCGKGACASCLATSSAAIAKSAAVATLGPGPWVRGLRRAARLSHAAREGARRRRPRQAPAGAAGECPACPGHRPPSSTRRRRSAASLRRAASTPGRTRRSSARSVVPDGPPANFYLVAFPGRVLRPRTSCRASAQSHGTVRRDGSHGAAARAQRRAACPRGRPLRGTRPISRSRPSARTAGPRCWASAPRRAARRRRGFLTRLSPRRLHRHQPAPLKPRSTCTTSKQLPIQAQGRRAQPRFLNRHWFVLPNAATP